MITETLEISESDLAPVVSKHTGNNLFRQALTAASQPRKLLAVLGDYIEFNSVFGGGVAALAGVIAERQDLFFDNEEPVLQLRDRSTVVASRIYAASVAEFGGESCHFTHRSLAQATLKGIAQYFDVGVVELNDLLQSSLPLEVAMMAVEDGYGVNRVLADEDLFRGIGFHMGSECLADEEFNILDQVLNEFDPGLVHYLKNTMISIGGEREHPAYDWIRIHTTVELDHFAFATKGANLALGFYQGSKEQMRQAVLGGFADFDRVQTGFMEHLLSR